MHAVVRQEVPELIMGASFLPLAPTHAHPIDRMIDGRGRFHSTPAIVVEGHATLRDGRDGSTCVHAGVYTIAEGVTHSGTIVLQPGSQLVVNGIQSGTVQIHENASMEIHGAHAGDLHVLRGGFALIATGGSFTGRAQIRGRVENAGVRDATVTLHGDGVLVDLAGSSLSQPDAANRDRHY